MPNLLLIDKHTKDVQGILHRVLHKLLDDKDCYYSNKREWKALTDEQTSNWRARRTIMRSLDKVNKRA